MQKGASIGVSYGNRKERRKFDNYAIRLMRSPNKKDRGYHCVDRGHVGIFESSQRSVVIQSRLCGIEMVLKGVAG